MAERTISFDELQEQIQSAYQRGEYDAALNLAERHASSFPKQAPLFYYWRICMNARLEQQVTAIQLLDEVLGSGVWYGEVLLRKSPALKNLQGIPDFEHLVALNRSIQAADHERRLPLIVLRSQGSCSKGQEPCPLLIALHGNASTAPDSLPLWQPAASAGWLVAAPQSSQAMWKDAFVWTDYEAASLEIQHHYAALKRQYAVNAAQVVLAGSSLGGETAVRLALSGDIPASGFLAVDPGRAELDSDDHWVTLIEAARQREATGGDPLRGVLIVGEANPPVALDAVSRLALKLKHAGIHCRLETVAGAAHDDLTAFHPAILRALEFFKP